MGFGVGIIFVTDIACHRSAAGLERIYSALELLPGMIVIWSLFATLGDGVVVELCHGMADRSRNPISWLVRLFFSPYSLWRGRECWRLLRCFAYSWIGVCISIQDVRNYHRCSCRIFHITPLDVVHACLGCGRGITRCVSCLAWLQNQLHFNRIDPSPLYPAARSAERTGYTSLFSKS